MDGPLVIDQIWRYPVKSVGGEWLERAEIGPLGIEGDRRWGIVDTATGRVLTGRRQPELLLARTTVGADGSVVVTDASGGEHHTDASLSAWLGRPVALVASNAAADVQMEVPDPDEQEWGSYDVAAEAWHDSPRARVSLLSHTSAEPWDVGRFRANLVLRGAGEDALVGSRVRLGGAVVEVGKLIGRCVMVNRPIPGADADPGVLRTILRERDGHLAVGAVVVEPGEVAVGDEVIPLG